MCECRGPSGPTCVAQSLDELEFERGLWCAAQYGDLDRTLHLLDKGFEVDRRDAAGYTALHYAARNGHLNVCRLLLDRGAFVDAVTPQGRATPLHRAATVGRLDIVEYLVGKGANVGLKDGDGRTALHRAAVNQHFDICEYLLELRPELGDDADNNNKTPADYVQSTDLTCLFGKGRE